MAWLTVKKSQVSQREWSALADVLRRIDAGKAAQVLADDAVSDKEMNAILDRNADGTVTYQDFGSFTHPLFQKLKRILKAHYFSAYRLWEPKSGNLPNVPFQFWSDVDFVHAATGYDRRLMKYASKRVALDVLFRDADLFQYAAPSLKRNRAFVLAAIKQNYHALEYAGVFRGDRDVVRSAVRVNPYALKYAAASIRRDKTFLLSIARKCWLVLFYADKEIKRDKAFVLSVLRRVGRRAYFGQMLPKPLRSDKAFVLKALRLVPDLMMVDPALRRDRDVFARYLLSHPVLLLPRVRWAWWLRHGRAYKGFDAFFTEEDCKDDATAFAAVWKFVRENVDLKRFFTAEELKSQTALFAALKRKYHISHPDRFAGVNTLIDVLKDRSSTYAPADTKPLCIIIMGAKDETRAFSTAHVDEMRRLGYRVVYYEAVTEDDVKKALKEATADGRYRAKAIVLGGHGGRFGLALGGKDPGRGRTFHGFDERRYVDITDFWRGDEFRLKRYIAHDGDIILEACSTGKGGASSPHNLANMVARGLPKGVALHSAMRKVGQTSFALKDNGLVPQWPKEVVYTVYRGEPLHKRRLKRQPVKRVASLPKVQRFYPLGKNLFRIAITRKPGIARVRSRPATPEHDRSSTSSAQRFYPLGKGLFRIDVTTTSRSPRPRPRPRPTPRENDTREDGIEF